jgi:hypothetical protein
MKPEIKIYPVSNGRFAVRIKVNYRIIKDEFFDSLEEIQSQIESLRAEAMVTAQNIEALEAALNA